MTLDPAQLPDDIVSLKAMLIAAALWLVYRLIRPADRWLRGDRTPESAVAAWSALAGLPVDLLRFGRGIPVALNTVPISISRAIPIT